MVFPLVVGASRADGQSVSSFAQERRDLKSLSIEKSPLDSDLIAIPTRAELIHRAFGKAFCDLIVGVNGWP